MLKEYDSILVMHDLVEQMGRKIVVDKSSNCVGNRSRLWTNEDIDKVMQNNWGTKEIEGVISSTSCEVLWDPEAFSTLHNLRLLMISSDFHVPIGLKCLSHALKVLYWTKYPLDTLPSGTRLHELVDLRMHHSKLKKLSLVRYLIL
ncbi:disease resistance protein RPP2B-like [Neltuma alba]|uniref:disease resistance protein RPP2B-like n=1 Tax=Neltuma alba TaxID=207710 RepID=UPI0010A50C45|nr:disease resistance protein RPP2B-like [Prosopis alba]